MSLESDLRRALREDQFVLHYQPIVPTDENRPLGFEALLRWERAPGVLVPPLAFIDVAEETGLIVFIGEQVMRRACRAAEGWNRDRQESDWISVSVNVSARQLQQPDFLQVVERALSEAGASPAMLRIELTESVAIANFDQAAAVLTALRRLGVRVSIDDFGTGHSSLGYLNALAFDTIKIDRSFVHAMEHDRGKRQIVEMVLDLAAKLDVSVVAEGAETSHQMSELGRLGCDFIQGFYVSRPLDEAAATDWLQDVHRTPRAVRAA